MDAQDRLDLRDLLVAAKSGFGPFDGVLGGRCPANSARTNLGAYRGHLAMAVDVREVCIAPSLGAYRGHSATSVDVREVRIAPSLGAYRGHSATSVDVREVRIAPSLGAYRGHSATSVRVDEVRIALGHAISL